MNTPDLTGPASAVTSSLERQAYRSLTSSGVAVRSRSPARRALVRETPQRPARTRLAPD